MTWQPIPQSNGVWEYDDAPPSPGTSSPLYPLWEKYALQVLFEGGTAGVRRTSSTHEVYVSCRRVDNPTQLSGELSKTYWDNR